uniref:MRG/MORF4L binding protein n=1 Tax=Eptatretus burgeri TaxID=7764 RepID=A0A8C4N6J5_EPTBU
MIGHKPVGVNRHFHMICIRDKFSQNIGRQVPSKVLWDHLNTFYDIQALNESEVLPFPNTEWPFSLPEEIRAVRERKDVAVKGGEGFEDVDKPRQPSISAEESKMAESVSSGVNLSTSLSMEHFMFYFS